MTRENDHYANFDVGYGVVSRWSWTCWESECSAYQSDFDTYSAALDSAYDHFDRIHGGEG